MDGNLRPSRNHGRSPFDKIRRTDVDPVRGEIEYWSARDAQELLGYKNWQTTLQVIDRAKAACRNNGYDVHQNFIEVDNIQGTGRQSAKDFHLSRLGMYLVAMNGNPIKKEIAAAQQYFAIQTRRAELNLPSIQNGSVPPQNRISPWAMRYRRTFSPHYRDLRDRHPGCFSVVTATMYEALFLEDEIIRHLMETQSSDRPDVSIGRTYSEHRKRSGMPCSNKTARLFLPDQGIDVEVAVYDSAEYGAFSIWFTDEYLPVLLAKYLDRKKDYEGFPALTRASVADNTCRDLVGRPAVLKDHLRAGLRAAGGFVPARQLPPGGSQPSLN